MARTKGEPIWSNQIMEEEEPEEEIVSQAELAAILGKDIEPTPSPLERLGERPVALDAPSTYMEQLKLEELIQRDMGAIRRVFRGGGYPQRWRANPFLKGWLKDNIESVLMDLNALRKQSGEPSFQRKIDLMKRKGASRFILWGKGRIVEEAQRQGIGLTRKSRPFDWSVEVKKLYQDYGKDGQKKTEPTRRIETMIDFAAWCQSLNNNNYDTVAVIDNPSNAFLTLSTGKTTVLSHVCHLVDKDFDLEDDMVYKDDYEKFWELLYDTTSFKATGVDEAHFFLNPTTKEGKEIRDQMKTNRHYNRYWFFATPTIWDCFPYFREKRCLFRICVEKRGEAQLFRRGGEMDKDEDIWGVPVTKWKNIDSMPRRVEKEYERLREEAGEKLRARMKQRHAPKEK